MSVCVEALEPLRGCALPQPVPTERFEVSLAMSAGAVLIVDDDVPWSETAAGALREVGFRVLLAHDGDEGAALLEREPLTVVILDVHLPRVSGLELLREFRQRDRLTPVLMVSADDQAAVQDRAMAEGASAFLRKPVAWSLLLRAVQRQATSGDSRKRRTPTGDGA
jgi:DNA-binding response OmpR family regulator